MTPNIRRRLISAAAVTIMLFLSGTGWMSAVGAAEGELTQIGGNGPTTCERTGSEAGLSLLPPPQAGIGGDGFRGTPGISGIASDMSGRGLYMAYGGQIFDRGSTIAGVDHPPIVPGKPAPLGSRENGARADATDLTGLTSIAADPYGRFLWVGLAPSSIYDPSTQTRTNVTGAIRRVDLLDPNKPITTVKSVDKTPVAMSADGNGNLYVAENTSVAGKSGSVYRLDAAGNRTELAQANSPRGIAVDVSGSHLFLSDTDTDGGGVVYRVTGRSLQVVADTTTLHRDSGSPSMNPVGLAIGHETDGQSLPTARYLYIADQQQADPKIGLLSASRVLRVDLSESPPVITTVAGGGSKFVSSADDGRTANIAAKFLAADISGHVYIAASDQCAIFALQTPSPFRLNTVVTNPPAATNTTLPSGGSRTGDNESTAHDPAPAGNGNTQADPGTGASQGNQTQIVPGSQTQVQAQPQTEIRVIDQGNVVTAPQQTGQPTVEPVPTPTGAAQFTPTPVQAPAPVQTPTPADVSTAVAPDPGPTSAAIADAAPAVPAAPVVAPVPPAPASAPPPAAQQPVANPGLVHGDSGAAPTRGATRYAMVRNDDDQPIAALAMAGAAAILAVFICVMFVAPGASTKPKPRPKGAY